MLGQMRSRKRQSVTSGAVRAGRIQLSPDHTTRHLKEGFPYLTGFWGRSTCQALRPSAPRCVVYLCEGRPNLPEARFRAWSASLARGCSCNRGPEAWRVLQQLRLRSIPDSSRLAPHGGGAVARCPPRFSLHFTDQLLLLNQVERWLGLLTDKQLGRGVHKNLHALEREHPNLRHHLEREPRPFTWTKTVDEIVARLNTYLK